MAIGDVKNKVRKQVNWAGFSGCFWACLPLLSTSVPSILIPGGLGGLEDRRHLSWW